MKLLPELAKKSTFIEPLISQTDVNAATYIPTLSDFQNLRNIYFNKRDYGWSILEEVIRMDMDSLNALHDEATLVTSQLLDR